jgi:hypothetical protein
MATTNEAIERLTFEYRTVGADGAVRATTQLRAGQDALASSTEVVTARSGSYDAALQRQMRTLEQINRTQRQLAEIQGRNAALLDSQTRAANDNAEAWHLSGLETAAWTNHLKQAAIAAYAVSPAFRQMVNPAITASVRASTTALSAMGPAAASAGLAAVRGMSPLLALAGRILLPITLVIDSFRIMAAITELGAQKLEELNKTAAAAAASGVGVDFFQRQAKAAEDLVGKADLATEALKRFNAVSQDKLGGSDLSNRINQLTGAGNFGGNSGVDAYKNAVTTEERYRAVVTLISEAMEKGERLAALDLAAKFLPPELTERLRQNGQFLREMQDTADKIKLSQIASAEDVGYAVELKRRLEEANKIIADGLKPLQRDLTQLGLNYQESWVNIVEFMAKAVKLADSLYAALKRIPDMFTWFGNLPIWTAIIAISNKLGTSSRPEGLVMKGEPGFDTNTGAGSKANSALAASLSDTNAVKRAMQEAIDVQTKLRGEISKPIVSGAAKAAADTKDAYDRAIETVEKHTARMRADAEAAGLGAGALEEFRARAQLMAAAMVAGREVTPQLVAEIDRLAKKAREAGIALEKAREQQQLFGNLASAASNAFRTIVDGFTSGKNAGEVFRSTLDGIGSSLKNIGSDALTKGFKGMLNGQGLTGFDPASLGIGAIGIGISLISNLFAQDDAAKKKIEEAQRVWKEAGPQFQLFLQQMSGGVQGELTQQIGSALDRINDLGKKAWEAGDYAAVTQMVDAFNAYVVNSSRKTMAVFQATIDGLTDGLGMDSPFLKAVNTVKDQLDAMEAFVDDTRTSAGIMFGTLTSDMKAINNPEGWAQVNAKVDEAKTAGQAYLLSLLQTAPKLSDVATQMLDLNGKAAALQPALEQLGMTSDQAAAAIKTGLTKAIDEIRKTFEDGLTARLNVASGKGYLNDTIALLLQHEQDIADAARVGTDLALVNKLFAAEAQKIVNDADLVGSAFSDFTQQFPELASVVTESSSAIEDAVKAQKTALASAAKTILDYVNSITAGSNSTLSPSQRLSAAQDTYNARLTLAQSGNADAQSAIAGDAENLRQAAAAMYGSTQAYQDILGNIRTQLLALPAVQQTTDPMLVVMRDVLTSINNGIATQATDATLLSTILPALNAGNAAATATALSTYFNKIDTNTSNSIDFNEMKAALGGMASDSALRAMFTRLDVDASGSIDRLDLIKAASQATNTNTLNTVTKVDDTKRTTEESNRIANEQYGLQATLNSLTNTSIEQLKLLKDALQPTSISVNVPAGEGGGGSRWLSNQLIDGINKIVWNTYATAKNTQLALGLDHAYYSAYGGTYAQGGWITGGIAGRDSVRLANGGLGMPGEFVVPFDIAQANKSWLPEFGRSGMLPAPPAPITQSLRIANDNSDLLAELRALRKEVADLRRDNNRITEASALHVGNKLGKVQGAVEEQTAVQERVLQKKTGR